VLECHVEGEFQRTGATRCLGHEQSALQRAYHAPGVDRATIEQRTDAPLRW
jgi:hypothetical protein